MTGSVAPDTTSFQYTISHTSRTRC